MKIAKVVWSTPIWFDGIKHPWGSVLTNVPDDVAASLEAKHMVVVMGEDTGTKPQAARRDVQVDSPARLQAPPKPPKAGKGPAPSIDDLLNR